LEAHFRHIPIYLGAISNLQETGWLKHYRRYVYEAGSVNRSEKLVAGVIDNSVLEKERKTPVKCASLLLEKI